MTDPTPPAPPVPATPDTEPPEDAIAASHRAVYVNPRRDGWTPEKQRDFIELLADTGSVTAAATRVGMSRESAYRLRRRTDARDFADAWEAALASATQRLVDSCFERAIDGVPVPILHRGEIIGHRRIYSDQLALFLLRHHDPLRYGALSGPQEYNAQKLDPHRPLLARLPHLLNRLARRGRWKETRTRVGV